VSVVIYDFQQIRKNASEIKKNVNDRFILIYPLINEKRKYYIVTIVVQETLATLLAK